MTYQEVINWLILAEASCGENDADINAARSIRNLLTKLETDAASQKNPEEIFNYLRVDLRTLNFLGSPALISNDFAKTFRQFYQTDIEVFVESVNQARAEALQNKKNLAAQEKKQNAIAVLAENAIDAQDLEKQAIELFLAELSDIISSPEKINESVKARSSIQNPTANLAADITYLESQDVLDQDGNLDLEKYKLRNNEKKLWINVARINNDSKNLILAIYGINNPNPSYRETLIIDGIVWLIIGKIFEKLNNIINPIISGDDMTLASAMLDIKNDLEKNLSKYALEKLGDNNVSLKDSKHGFEFNDEFVAKLKQTVSIQKGKERIQDNLNAIFSPLKAFSRKRAELTFEVNHLDQTIKRTKDKVLLQLAKDINRSAFKIQGIELTENDKLCIEARKFLKEEGNDFENCLTAFLTGNGFKEEHINLLLQYYHQKPSYSVKRYLELIETPLPPDASKKISNVISHTTENNNLYVEDGQVYFEFNVDGLFVKDDYDASLLKEEIQGQAGSQFQLTPNGFEFVTFTGTGEAASRMNKRLAIDHAFESELTQTTIDLAIIGITNYLEEQALKSDTGRDTKRAEFYLKELTSPTHSELRKEIMVYALLADFNHSTLKEQVVAEIALHADPELYESISLNALARRAKQHFAWIAGDKNVKNFDPIVDKIILNAKSNGALPKHLDSEINNLTTSRLQHELNLLTELNNVCEDYENYLKNELHVRGHVIIVLPDLTGKTSIHALDRRPENLTTRDTWERYKEIKAIRDELKSSDSMETKISNINAIYHNPGCKIKRAVNRNDSGFIELINNAFKKIKEWFVGVADEPKEKKVTRFVATKIMSKLRDFSLFPPENKANNPGLPDVTVKLKKQR